MNTVIFVASMLMIGLISLVFLYVFLKIVGLISNLHGLKNDLEDDKQDDEEEAMKHFKNGVDKGIAMAQMCLYKMWVDGGETVVVGSFDVLKQEIVENMTKFFQQVGVMKEWNDKFTSYLNTTKDAPK